MTEALKKEVEELEKEELDEEEESPPEGEEPEEAEEAKEAAEETQEEEELEKEDERLKAQEAYRERQEKQAQRREELQKQVDKGDASSEEASELDALKKKTDVMEQYVRQQVYHDRINQAANELAQIEAKAKTDPTFQKAYPDYEETVTNAVEFAKIRLVQSGMSEEEATKQVNYEKTMIADRAVAQGNDPLLAIYEEGQMINNTFETFAEKMGYVKAGKKVTNLQAQREMSKPNAMDSGKGSAAAKYKFDDLGDDDLQEIKETNIWDTVQ